MLWDVQSASKKFESRNLPKDAILWSGVVCFFIALFAGVEFFFHLIVQTRFWIALGISVVAFYGLFQILSILGLFCMEKFVNLYKKK